MIPPIPRAILKMAATLYPRTGDDGYGNPSYGTGVPLSQILIEPSRNVIAGSLGEQAKYDLVLFFDAANSLPAGRIFTDKDKVDFSGTSYNVRSARMLHDPLNGRLHHWGVRLVGN